MSSSEESTPFSKTIPASEAGKSVGFINVERRDDDFVFANLAVARIGVDGAKYVIEQRRRDNQPGYEILTQGGFDNTVEIGAAASIGERNIHMQPFSLPWQREYAGLSAGEIRNAHVFTSTLSVEHRPDAGLGVWAIGEREILLALKAELGKQDAAWMYSALYYSLACLAEADDQLADPEMADITLIELDLAQERERILLEAAADDQTILEDITDDFEGHQEILELPALFEANRKRTAERESDLTLGVSISALRSLRAYAPTGQGRGGRTWPYMDASEEDPRKAYGLELSDLERGAPARAESELNREIKELRARAEFTRNMSRRLGSLLHKETNYL